MPNNKITIGVGKQEENDKTQRIPKEELYSSVAPVESEQKPEVLEDRVWGNDYILDKKLDKEHLDEKRMFVRVRYIQNISCDKICDDINSQPTTLTKPIKLVMSDISVGGLGAVCGQELNVGSVLEFDIVLDHLTYTIKCEIVYCILMEESYRIGLKIVRKNRDFLKHLKILVARISLQAQYGGKS